MKPLDKLSVSIIIPIFNEEGNLPELYARLFAVIDANPWSVEVIAVNDGSSDSSAAVLDELAAKDKRFKVIHFRRNFGQTAALMAGIDHSKGDIFVFIDADLQNDPSDIPKLIERVVDGYDVVSGWRVERKDSAITRTFPSRLANALISSVSGVHLRDYGCTLKAYRREVLGGSRLYGEMHRFIPIYASWMGAKVIEMPVAHHPRSRGESKYGLGRVFKVLLDLMVVKFLDSYLTKPIYVFGGFGGLCMTLGVVIAMISLWHKFVNGVSLIQTPLPLLAAMTFLVGLLSLLIGLLAEIMVRVYFEAQGRPAYAVRETRNTEPSA
jgi:glycosyltransferase involved in cell wall biosynthesis